MLSSGVVHPHNPAIIVICHVDPARPLHEGPGGPLKLVDPAAKAAQGRPAIPRHVVHSYNPVVTGVGRLVVETENRSITFARDRRRRVAVSVHRLARRTGSRNLVLDVLRIASAHNANTGSGRESGPGPVSV